MRKQSELVRATKRFAHEQRWRSWWHLWSTLAVVGSLLTVTTLDLSLWLRLPCSVLAGMVLVRLFIIYHDYLHGTILAGSWLAEGIMWAYGLLAITPPSIWRRSHNHHHKHNARTPETGIGSYPVMTTTAYARATRLQRFCYALARHPLTILLGYFTVFLFNMCLWPFLLHPKEHFDGAIALVLHLALVAVLAIFAPSILLLTLLLPMMIGCALGSYLFYAQHNFPGVKFLERSQWDYVAAALASSSYMVMNGLLRWLTGNIGYHHVHHINSHIPFYRLPEAMAQMAELQSPGKTSLHPLEIRRCLRLKLWDPEQQRMVTFKEAC